MKSITILTGLVAFAITARAQLTTGPTGLTIKAGTAFSSQGLVLTPSTDLTLQNDTIRLSGVPLTVGSGASISRVYTISPSVSFSGTLGIQYASPELNGNQENTLSVIKAAPGASFTSVISATGAGGSYYVYGNGLNNIVLNRVTATSVSVPLPVHYHSLTAAAGPSCSVDLSWIADKAQPRNFQVERSHDGIVFKTLSSPVLQLADQFSCSDPSPLPGRNIYRLAIKSTDEPVVYSTMLTANNPCATLSSVTVHPNPATELITVTLDNLPDGSATIDLLDITGNVLKTVRTTNKVNNLNLQGIAAGSYLLRVQSGISEEHIKIVKR